MPSHSVFTCWCKSVQRYLEVLPQSALDVKFDWSKLLSAVANPIESGESQGEVEFCKALACVNCVAAAMRARAETMQLSKSQRAWLETLLRLRSADSEELRNACTEQIMAFLLGRGLLGPSERKELELLLTALEKRASSSLQPPRILHVVGAGTFIATSGLTSTPYEKRSTKPCLSANCYP
eukprot:symbB.v1.2.008806.t1/scaffold536.1/size343967/22